MDNDNNVLKTQNVPEGEGATAPNAPVPVGYDFVGWDKEFDNVTSNLIVTAIYEAKQYIVTFASPEGIIIAQKTVLHGTSVTPPAVQETYFHFGTKTPLYESGNGYYFVGWDHALENITENQTITAIYGNKIQDPIVAVEQKVIVKGNEREITLQIWVISQNPLGISLDLQIDPTLLVNTPQITTKAEKSDLEQDIFIGQHYESTLHEDGKYEFRWAKQDGISNTDIITFTFVVDPLINPGEYIIELLNSTYLISSQLEKISPVLISGAVIVDE